MASIFCPGTSLLVMDDGLLAQSQRAGAHLASLPLIDSFHPTKPPAPTTADHQIVHELSIGTPISKSSTP